MFRSSFSGRHRMVLTDGFYEWHTDSKTGRKQPYRFVMKSGEPFATAARLARRALLRVHRWNRQRRGSLLALVLGSESIICLRGHLEQAR